MFPVSSWFLGVNIVLEIKENKLSSGVPTIKGQKNNLHKPLTYESKSETKGAEADESQPKGEYCQEGSDVYFPLGQIDLPPHDEEMKMLAKYSIEVKNWLYSRFRASLLMERKL